MNRRGFTLVELLVSISILAILTIIAIPTIRTLQSNNKTTQYNNYKKTLQTSGKLYNDSYTEDLFGDAPYGCQKVDLSELIKKKVAKDISLKDVTCNVDFKDSFVTIKKFNNEYKYNTSLYCENSKHVEQYSDSDDILSDCVNDTGTPWISVTTKTNDGTDKNNTVYEDIEHNSKNKSVTINLLDNYGFTKNQEVEYAWSTEKNAENVPASSYKKYKYNNPYKKTTGTTVILKSKSITIPGGVTGNYYIYVKPIRVQNIVNQSYTGIKRFGPFRFDHEAPKCEYIKVKANVSNNAYTKELYFDISYDSKLDDLSSYTLEISYDNGVHWIAEKTRADYSFVRQAIETDGDIKYRLTNLVDNIGNKRDSCTNTEVYHLDNKPPTCSISFEGTKRGSGYYQDSAKGKITSSELNDSTYGINNKNEKNYNSKNSLDVNTTGSNTVYGFIKDKAGNEGQCQASTNVTKKFTITYNGNGGTVSTASKQVYWGDAIGTLPTVTKAGYKLKGWYTEASNGSQVSSTTKMPNNNVTYYAQWSPNVCTVTYHPNNGKFNSHTDDTVQKFYYDGNNNAVTNMRNAKKGYFDATRTGYSIVSEKEWKNGTTTYNQDSGYRATDFCPDLLNGDQSVTLKVNWKIKTFTVTLRGEEGAKNLKLDNSKTKLSKTVNYGDTITVSTGTENYYQFEQWSTGDTNKTETYTVTSDMTITAKIRKNTVKTWFYGNGGHFAEGPYQSFTVGATSALFDSYRVWDSKHLAEYGVKSYSTPSTGAYMVRSGCRPTGYYHVGSSNSRLHLAQDEPFPLYVDYVRYCGLEEDFRTKDVVIKLYAGWSC